MKSILVFGSINIDLVTKTPRLPIAGETLQGYDFFTAPGGKGANQAVAAARLGIATHLVGRVGNDDFGRQLLANLQVAGVHTDGVLVDTSITSGIAVITVDDAGENQIIIIPGANGQLDESDVERLKGLLPGATALLMQLEIPLSRVLSAAQAAHAANVPVILDPAPAQNLPDELYPLVDIITPNQLEASHLVGFPVNEIETAHQAATVLRQRGVATVIVKLGAQGAYCTTASETFFVPAFSVQAVDTVAAGDAFNGALAVALAEGLSLREAVLWGVAAGAISVTKAGAQPSLPDRDTFDQFLRDRGVINL
ncbi:MAG TPA: ribokinase [Cyanobacteria bacterium UBA12227]|nr:ribokinase [Cyanobacteria bacterium UBA12227]HAX86825.1 ribokinase [Cyanobacteria bacterium UBA11370]HBY80555.1 ribokinase [Cyanobacteria bacterium UBA11148]